jgi:hypothetical protein
MITQERKAALLRHFNATTPEERDYIADMMQGFPSVPAEPRPDNHDWEGAIMERQERSGMYD